MLSITVELEDFVVNQINSRAFQSGEKPEKVVAYIISEAFCKPVTPIGNQVTLGQIR